MKEDKFKRAARLLREWQNEDKTNRGTLLCACDLNTGTSKSVYGTFLTLGSALYPLYKDHAIIREIIAKIMEVYKSDPQKSTASSSRKTSFRALLKDMAMQDPKFQDALAQIISEIGEEAEPRQVNTACYVEKNEGTLNIL